MLNNVIMQGRLTADPEKRTTDSGVLCCRFNLAVDRSYRKQGEEKQTDFFPVVAWRQTAEFITKYFRKGQMIIIEGELHQTRFTDRQGEKRVGNEIVAAQAYFDGPKNGAENKASAPGAQTAQRIQRPDADPAHEVDYGYEYGYYPDLPF